MDAELDTEDAEDSLSAATSRTTALGRGDAAESGEETFDDTTTAGLGRTNAAKQVLPAHAAAGSEAGDVSAAGSKAAGVRSRAMDDEDPDAVRLAAGTTLTPGAHGTPLFQLSFRQLLCLSFLTRYLSALFPTSNDEVTIWHASCKPRWGSRHTHLLACVRVNSHLYKHVRTCQKVGLSLVLHAGPIFVATGLHGPWRSCAPCWLCISMMCYADMLHLHGFTADWHTYLHNSADAERGLGGGTVTRPKRADADADALEGDETMGVSAAQTTAGKHLHAKLRVSRVVPWHSVMLRDPVACQSGWVTRLFELKVTRLAIIV